VTSEKSEVDLPSIYNRVVVVGERVGAAVSPHDDPADSAIALAPTVNPQWLSLEAVAVRNV
jgi:hypothetical protein